MQLSRRTAGFTGRWRAAAARLVAPGAILVCAWILINLPGVLREAPSGAIAAFQASFGPILCASLLVVSMALIEAARLHGRRRVLAMTSVAMLAPALTLTAVGAIMIGTGMWPAPSWSLPVIWWANYGGGAMICLGAVFVEDQRVRSKLRTAALRDARLRAAEVAGRTAEVRLQAARARVEPRFLFDALSAVERVYETDAAAGNRLLDDLVTYLRAVMPDLRESQRDVARETEIARLRLAIESAIAQPRASTVE